MPRQVIINMEEKYPFGECEQGDDQTVRVLVRRKVYLKTQPEIMIEKANYFRRLNQNCIIRIQQINQEQECLHLLYQYVPIRMQTWISNINQKFIEGFCRQLIQLGEYLAKCYINVQLTLENVGMDENYKPKYFLDFDFQVNESLDKQILKKSYHTQVLSLFRPYVQSKILPKTIKSREDLDFKNDNSSSRALAIPRPSKNDTSSSSTIRLRQKAVALQKQRKNESISVKGSNWDMMPSQKSRKQSILSSVSNIKINRIGRRIDQIKNKLRGIYSPEPLYLRHQQRSIEKGSNSIAFNWDSTQKLYTHSVNPKQDALQSQAFCNNIFRQIQQQESIFQKFEKSLAKQLTRVAPLKKNQTLKAKQYQQMKKSDDGYFKDFFQVLQDKPKVLAVEVSSSPPIYNSSHHLEYPRQPIDIGKSLVKAQQRSLMNSEQEMVRYDSSRGETIRDKSGIAQLQNRVKSAINKSKKLINKFKTDK